MLLAFANNISTATKPVALEFSAPPKPRRYINGTKSRAFVKAADPRQLIAPAKRRAFTAPKKATS